MKEKDLLKVASCIRKIYQDQLRLRGKLEEVVAERDAARKERDEWRVVGERRFAEIQRLNAKLNETATALDVARKERDAARARDIELEAELQACQPVKGRKAFSWSLTGCGVRSHCGRYYVKEWLADGVTGWFPFCHDIGINPRKPVFLADAIRICEEHAFAADLDSSKTRG